MQFEVTKEDDCTKSLPEPIGVTTFLRLMDCIDEIHPEIEVSRHTSEVLNLHEQHGSAVWQYDRLPRKQMALAMSTKDPVSGLPLKPETGFNERIAAEDVVDQRAQVL